MFGIVLTPAGRIWTGSGVARSLGDAAASGIPAPPASAADLIKALLDHQQRQFHLALVSTTAAVAASIITFYRTARLLKQERRAATKA